MAIEVLTKQRLVKIDRQGIADLVSAALALIGGRAKGNLQNGTKSNSQGRAESDWHLTVAFVRDKHLQQLNRDYRGKDYLTDVLSFPARAEAGEAFDFSDANFLGDIVISVDTALRQSQEATHSFERETQELVIHGVLHLCGYDHETDNGEMNRLELKLRKRLLD